MKTKRFLMLALAFGLAACGGTVALDQDEGGEPPELHTASVIVGPADWISATQLSGTEAERAKAVGYLQVPGTGIRCTAWLASKDIVITTRHCIDSEWRAKGARVSFNFNDGVSAEQTVWYDCSQFVKTWEKLDMTALRCAPGSDGKRPGEVYGYLRVSDEGTRWNESIYILHQACDRYTNPGCALTKKYSPGSVMNPTYRITDVSYNADTLESSSGAPVLSSLTHEVIALHHAGYDSDESERGSYNSGVRAGLIREALRDLEIGCPVYQGETCYWMGFHDTGNWSAWCWVPATWASDYQACYEMDSCSGGLGASGGGCYKWALSSEAPGTPW